MSHEVDPGLECSSAQEAEEYSVLPCQARVLGG